jgi:hypothetical protein
MKAIGWRANEVEGDGGGDNEVTAVRKTAKLKTVRGRR